VIYNFDKSINRKGTNSSKHDTYAQHGVPEDAIPLWVADMDFASPIEVAKRLGEIASFGVFGYTSYPDSYFEAVSNWFSTNFGFKIDQAWIKPAPGVMAIVANAIRAFTDAGDGVLIQRPSYHPFPRAVELNGRNLVNSPLVFDQGRYNIDFDDFEKKVVEENVKLFLLCSPHNPVGRVWTKKELEALCGICLKHKVVVVADEIHCDFVFGQNTHTMYQSIGKEALDNSICAVSASKTFNLAGLSSATAIVPNPALREAYEKAAAVSFSGGANMMGVAASEAAYKYGKDWLSQLNTYLHGNILYVKEFLENNLDQIGLIEHQGTYLLWLDFHKTGFSHSEIESLVLDKAKLWLNSGTVFGQEGSGFMRMNIASPRDTIATAMERLKTAFS